MSGIVGLLRTDGQPLAPDAVVPFTDSLTFRGPHGRGTWQDGSVALGHTLLRATYEAAHERQPLAAGEGRYHIAADARIDAREELIARLDISPSNDLLHVPDVELILHAYAKWGECCVDHLLGDFAFAIWDAREQRLFCARDHMGVKPFFYAHVGPWLVFSNTLDCVRSHAGVSARLDDLAVADCLLFGGCQEPHATLYADVRRLPAAHTLTWADGRLQVRRYWSLPMDEPVYYRRDEEYVERFRELLGRAVADRLRADRVSVFFSGGLDSTLLAATAKRLIPSEAESSPVQAWTFVYQRLIEDEEGHYAGIAARHIGIPVHLRALDEQVGWSPPGALTPEPLDTPANRSAELRVYSEVAAHGPVALYGEGPDNALNYEWRPHLRYLCRKGRWGRLAADVAKHVKCHRRIPLVPSILQILKQRQAGDTGDTSFPQWLEADIVESLRLRSRWRELGETRPSAHPTRPIAHASLSSILWPALFESLDPSYTGAAVDVRHPYVDVRLLQFMLSVPALPWCRTKHLVRRAGVGLLPPRILSRPKTPLVGFPGAEHARRCGMPPIVPSEALSRYVNVERVSSDGPGSVPALWNRLRLVAVSRWLAAHESVIFSQG